MPISNLPVALESIIQEGYLEREFLSGLTSMLGYREVADRESFPTRIGETTTKTRRGLKTPVTTPLDPSTNTNFDNGLTPSDWTVEQYVLGIDMYGDTMDLNSVTSGVEIASRFLENQVVNGTQAAQSLNRLARNKLFDGYMTANSWVTATLGAGNVTIEVDDVRHFNEISVNGTMIPVSVTNPRNVTVGSNVYSLTAVAVDVTNTSSIATFGGLSGTLTFAAAVTVADGTLNNGVIAAYAPVVLRPNAKDSTPNLVSTDILTMKIIQDAVTILRNNNVPTINGMYNMYLDMNSMSQLYRDTEFQTLYRGNPQRKEYVQGIITELQGVRFISTTETYQQTLGTVSVKRPIICGAGILIEGTFDGQGALVQGQEQVTMIREVNGVISAVRGAMDRLGQIIAQSWYWIGGYSIPTDVTATTDIIPTGSDSYYKRGVVIETA